jgi:hypothetical protein
MVEREPKLFKNWDPYMRSRQVMVSATIFKNRGWSQWQTGHAKLLGVILWDYETKNHRKFKYNHTLKKKGYRRTHNYRLLKDIIKNNILQKEGNGYYSFNVPEVVIKKILKVVKELDKVSNNEAKVEQKSESTAS